MQGFKYVPKSERKVNENKASTFTGALMNSEFDKYGNFELVNDHQLLKTGSFYLPNFFCKNQDFEILTKLKHEINLQNPVTCLFLIEKAIKKIIYK